MGQTERRAGNNNKRNERHLLLGQLKDLLVDGEARLRRF